MQCHASNVVTAMSRCGRTYDTKARTNSAVGLSGLAKQRNIALAHW